MVFFGQIGSNFSVNFLVTFVRSQIYMSNVRGHDLRALAWESTVRNKKYREGK